MLSMACVLQVEHSAPGMLLHGGRVKHKWMNHQGTGLMNEASIISDDTEWL